MTLRVFTLILTTLALAACGGDEESSAPTPADGAAASTPAQAGRSAQNTARPAEQPIEQGYCALIEPSEIEALFPADLAMKPPRVEGRADNPLHACRYDLGIGEVGQLTFGTTSEGMYNEYAKYLQQSSTPSRMIEGLGEEAFLLNNAQLLVRRADGQFLNISLMLITMGELPLSQEDLAEGVVGLGRLLDERLTERGG